MESLGPDLTEHVWVEGRAVRDDFVGLDPSLAQALEEALDVGLLDVAVNELVSDQPVAAWRGRIDGEEQRQLVLVDLIDTEDAGELSNYPRLVVLLEGQSPGVIATPEPDHPLAGPDPEVAGEALGNSTEGQAVAKDRIDRLLDHPPGVGGVWPQERWLEAEVVPTGRAEVDADDDLKQHRAVEIDVDGDSAGVPDTPGDLGAVIAGGDGLAAADLAVGEDDLIGWQSESIQSQRRQTNWR